MTVTSKVVTEYVRFVRFTPVMLNRNPGFKPVTADIGSMPYAFIPMIILGVLLKSVLLKCSAPLKVLLWLTTLLTLAPLDFMKG